MTNMELAKMIDHTCLRPDAIRLDIEMLCADAREYGFYSVCVNPYWIADARRLLEGSNVKVCTVAGFPLGAVMSRDKAAETRYAVEAGADEVDVVMNVGAAKEGHWNFIEHEAHEVVSAAGGRVVKWILETCYLTEDEIREACLAAKRGGVAFVKSSTGFGQAGAKVEHVRLMREAVGHDVGVKASGGVRTKADALRMIEAGASRLGCSNSVEIVRG